MSTRIDQLLHGYRRGHERLAGSMRLPARDTDLVTRLSDLSGTLAGAQDFVPYLTIYPLPSRSHIAVAKTWPDTDAARAGCVLTHTLLVPVEAWRTSTHPSDVAALFRSPVGRQEEASYSAELNWPSDASAARPVPLSRTTVDKNVGFVRRYFVEGKKPVVWFGHPDPNTTLWLLFRGLWPALRGNFAACTLCLHPRTLEDRPFDLMFAPPEAYPRFLKIPPDNVVDASRPTLLAPADQWCWRWAERLFASADLDDAFGADLWADLDDDPTAIRRLYLIETALLSEPEVPQAAVGAMDLVESVARAPDTALRTKTRVATRAVELAAAARDPSDGLESLRLIEDRLRRAAYASASRQIGPLLANVVAAYTKRVPELVASLARPTDDPSVDTQSWYAKGLLEGFKRLADEEPLSLTALRSLPSVRASLVAADPSIALSYAQALFSRRTEDGIQQALTDWLRSSATAEQRRSLRHVMLSNLATGDIDLLGDLLRDVTEAEVDSVLTALAGSLGHSSVAKVVENTVVREHPAAAQSSLKRFITHDPEQVRLLASTYPASRQGLSNLLDDADIDPAHRALSAAAFLIQLGRGRFPAWVRQSADGDARLFSALLHPLAPKTPSIDNVVEQLLYECEDLPLAHFPVILAGITGFEECLFFPRLLDVFLRDLIRGYLDGTVTGTDVLHVMAHASASNWIRGAPYTDLRSLFTHQVWNRIDNWLNGWKLAQIAPSSLYERESLLPDVIDALLRAYYVAWSPIVAHTWTVVLQRSRTECPSPSTRLHLSVQALQYALSNPRYPLSEVVAATFLDVYRAVTSPTGSPSGTSSLFGWMSWDKGKELRKSLIDAFMNSQWPPGALALAANDSLLFRKIFKRVMRRSGGDRYLHAMLSDLRDRSSPDSRQIERTLAALLEDPNFYEEWD